MKKLFLLLATFSLVQVLTAQKNLCDKYECSNVDRQELISDNTWTVYNAAGVALNNSKTVCPPSGSPECSGAIPMWHGPLKTCPTLTGVNFAGTTLKFRKSYPVIPTVGPNECWTSTFSYCLKTNLSNVVVTIGGVAVPLNGSYQLQTSNAVVEITSYAPNPNWNSTQQPYISFVGYLDHSCNYGFGKCDNIDLGFNVNPVLTNNVITGITPVPINPVTCPGVQMETWNVSILENPYEWPGKLICLSTWEKKFSPEGTGYTFSNGFNQWLIEHGGCATLLITRTIYGNCGFKKRHCKKVKVCAGADVVKVETDCNCKSVKEINELDCIYPLKVVKNSNTNTTLFPNPANEKFIANNNFNEPVTVNIYNLNGQVMHSGKIDSNSFSEIITTHYEDGVYIVKLKGVSGEELVQRVMISH